jgi:hypothetical protein
LWKGKRAALPDRAYAIFNLVIPAKAGIQKAYFRRNAPPFFPSAGEKRTGFLPSRE